MFLVIHLQDDKNVSIRRKQLQFQEETTIEQLKEKIQSLFYVEIEHQQLFDSNSRRIDLLPGLLKDAQLQDNETLILNHSLFKNWRSYIQMTDEIRKLTTSGATDERREIYLKARAHLSAINASKFLVSFPKLAIEELHLYLNMNFLIHNTKKYLYRSVSPHFEALFPGKTVELKEKPKAIPGSPHGVLVFVDNQAAYYAKALSKIPDLEDYETDEDDKSLNSVPKIDLIEIFVYILLKMIGVGPVEVHVIPDTKKSDLVFIATRLIDGFRTASGVSVAESLANPSISFSAMGKSDVFIAVEMKKQMALLLAMLCLKDVTSNKGNHGVVEIDGTTRELRIVDFGINLWLLGNEPHYLTPSFDKSYVNSYLEKWDFRNNVYKAKEEMDNLTWLRNNENVNRRTFNWFFERLEEALTYYSE